MLYETLIIIQLAIIYATISLVWLNFDHKFVHLNDPSKSIRQPNTFRGIRRAGEPE